MSKIINAADLNIDLSGGDEQELFKWFIASFLMGKRIRSDIAAAAYRVIIEKNQRDTARKLGACTHGELIRMLGEGGYARYDESTADRLLKLSKKLNDEYGGKIVDIRRASHDQTEFEKRLAVFEGIGPKTIEIFMRDAQRALF